MITLFDEADYEIHHKRKHAQNHGCRHHQIYFENLPAIDNQIAKPCLACEIFSHDAANPTQHNKSPF